MWQQQPGLELRRRRFTLVFLEQRHFFSGRHLVELGRVVNFVEPSNLMSRSFLLLHFIVWTIAAGMRPPSKHAHMLTTDLPDELLEHYLVFSFVRDPFTRAVASFYQASRRPTDRFAEHLRGSIQSNNGKYPKLSSMAITLPS